MDSQEINKVTQENVELALARWTWRASSRQFGPFHPPNLQRW